MDILGFGYGASDATTTRRWRWCRSSSGGDRTRRAIGCVGAHVARPAAPKARRSNIPAGLARRSVFCPSPHRLSRARPDWSRPLPQPLQILDENDKPILTLKTLGDVRKMLLGLPEPFQLKTTWGHVGVMLDEAARGGDIVDVVVPLRMVLGMECVACRPK
jgi:hypothetical protein